jgi:Fe-S cluster assembly ATP-binding protein
MLTIKNLWATVDGSPIIKGLDLQVNKGEIHAIMGPNGAGKSTLAKILAGHPAYDITEGTILYKENDLGDLEPEERAQKGLFMGFQYPVEIPGVSNNQFLRLAYNYRQKALGKPDISEQDFDKLMDAKMKEMDIKTELKLRNVNEGFSGGEKKRNEILQMAILKPELAILDETDSGLDIDALKIVAKGVNHLMNKDMGLIIITHYQRLLDYIKPHHVHVMVDGRIVQSGGPELALLLEEKGYDWLMPASEGDVR